MLNNFKVSRKLAIGFGSVVAVIVASSTTLYLETRSLHETERLNSVSDAAVDDVDKAGGDLSRAQSAVRKMVATGSDGDRASLDRAVAAHHADLAQARAILAKDAPDLLPRLDAYEKTSVAYIADVLDAEARLAASATTRPQALEMVVSAASKATGATMEQQFEALRSDTARWSDTWTVTGDAEMDRMLIVVGLSGALSTLLAAVMAWLIARAIARPIGSMTVAMQDLAGGHHAIDIPALGRRDEIGAMAEAVQVFKAAAIEKERLEADALAAGRLTEAERARNAAALAASAAEQARVVDLVGFGLARLSEGDLVHRIAEAFPADYERLRANFNDATAKLQNTMRTVAGSASVIRSGTGEISTASGDLSHRTEQQAASLEETAAALDEITATVRKTAQGSQHARSVVSTAKDSAEQSGRVVDQAVEAMSGIERSAREITQIIGVIDEIAFQTNLLALNAGVEAARAGEAGRGFAVVASEVRALAQRSAEAAKEIKGLISTSSRQVEQGVAFVGQTGEALSRIIAQVAEIDGIVGEIAASAQEQATALDQVNTAVNQMDQVTQQNAAMVEEATAASQALAHETGELAQLIGQFQIGEAEDPHGHGVVSRPATAARAAGPVRALRVVGRGGAAPKTEAASPDWAEF